MMDITDKESYRSLYSELKQYEKRGIDILMDGYQVSPMQIVTAYMAKEEGAYMRDYVMDQNGRLESLTFTDVDELNVDKFGKKGQKRTHQCAESIFRKSLICYNDCG